MKTYWGVEVQLHAFFDLYTRWRWVVFTSRPLYSQGKTPGTHWTGGWVDPRADLDTVSKRKISSPPPGIEPRSSDCLARSQSLYRLSYPGCHYLHEHCKIRSQGESQARLGFSAVVSTCNGMKCHLWKPVSFHFQKYLFILIPVRRVNPVTGLPPFSLWTVCRYSISLHII
jgi:hypothetical protein